MLRRRRADANPKLLVCGRLGEYKYYDMDQAIATAMVLAERILSVDSAQRIIVPGTRTAKRPSCRPPASNSTQESLQILKNRRTAIRRVGRASC